MSVLNFSPVPSTEGFFVSNKFVNLICGPVGSTKTTASLVKVAFEAAQVAKSVDGVRRSRVAVIRNTREQLRDTTIPDWLKWFPDGIAGAYLKSEMKYILRFNDVECEVLFRGLDDSDDVRRLLSLQLTFGVMDEFREIHPDIFEALQGRLGRYPDGILVPHRAEWGLDSKGNPIQGCVRDDGSPADKVWGASNPPDMDTFWEDFLSNPPSNAAVFIQPSGLSPEADWIHLLKSGFYENLAEGKSEDWIDVYINAQFGKSLSGKPVFRSFSRDAHVSKNQLEPNRLSINPILVGFDCTGLNPAAVVGQVGFAGRLQVYDALHAVDMGPIRFIREALKPLLASKYAGMKVLTVIDPAGMSRGADERNVADMLRAEGLVTRPARTNGVAARISAVEHFLTRMMDGKPGLTIDPGCTQLVQALAGKYRFKVNAKGETADTPEKSHPWADIADAMQYLCLHADGGSLFGAEVMSQRRELKPAAVRFR